MYLTFKGIIRHNENFQSIYIGYKPIQIKSKNDVWLIVAEKGQLKASITFLPTSFNFLAF